MTMFQIVIICSCFLGLTLGRTVKDIKEAFVEIGLECNKEHPVSEDEFEMLKSHSIPENNNAKCLLACTYKKLNWMDSKGMFDDSVAYKMSEDDYKDHPEKLKNARLLYDECKKVNDAAVGDGENGCDRAVLLTKCFTENSGKIVNYDDAKWVDPLLHEDIVATRLQRKINKWGSFYDQTAFNTIYEIRNRPSSTHLLELDYLTYKIN